MQTNPVTNTPSKKKPYRDVIDPINDSLIYQIQSGDHSAFPVLLDRCQILINRAIVRRYIKGYDRDDLYQEACLVLVESSQKYEFNKGMTFNQYICLCMDNHFNRLIRWNNALKRQSIRDALSLDGMIEESGLQLSESFSSPGPEDWPIIEETVEDYLVYLSPYEREVCVLCYKGHTYDSIAEELKCSREKVVNAKHRCTEKFRKLFL